ncbi:MAG: hypothetical protein KF817_07120 [Phycisphaeraceae bacterium]|nr:hypothetical protein [Phycisphaeraceae bacterium]
MAGAPKRLLDLFSSIPLGLVTLTLLFIYSSIGSAGIPTSWRILEPASWTNVREVFELSEFEWFHWWPFNVLIALLCLNIIVATIRRIPFNVVNLGVWMIHSGILVIAAGSVWYFGAKIEGDAPIARRQIRATLPGGMEAVSTAMPGARLGFADPSLPYRMRVLGITPDWELLSGDDAGKRVYKVSLLVDNGRETFVRELLAGYPQYTEDLVRSADPAQPWARARNVRGTALVDDELSVALEYEPQSWFYVMESRALYLREIRRDASGVRIPTPWIERPIARMPIWSDRIASPASVWADPGTLLPPARSLRVDVPALDPEDPLDGTAIRLAEYVRYGELQRRRVPGGDVLSPAVGVTFANDAGLRQSFQLAVSPPEESRVLDGALEFHWIDDEAALDRLREVIAARLEIEVPGEGIAVTPDIVADEQWRPVGGGSFRFRVMQITDALDFGQWSGALAVVELSDGQRTWQRWVFEDPANTREAAVDGAMSAHSAPAVLDDRIVTRFRPGRRSAIRLVAGPERETLRLLVPVPGGSDPLRVVPVRVGAPVPIASGMTLTIDRYAAETRSEVRPLVVPPNQRSREVGLLASMVRVSVPTGDGYDSHWLPFHRYPFDSADRTLRRYPYRPTTVVLKDGREIEMLFSRRRERLPRPAVLEDFVVKSHIGGFTGSTASILDWQSRVKFVESDGWSDPILVSVNQPKPYGGLWYFQAQWDPPDQSRGETDPGSAGLNYTVLGVANRHGVLVQLFGCCLSVVGMIYAFYVKPYIKRRRAVRVHAELAASTSPGRRPDRIGAPPPAPVEVLE